MDELKPEPVVITPEPAHGKRFGEQLPPPRKTVAAGSSFSEEDLRQLAQRLAEQVEAKKKIDRQREERRAKRKAIKASKLRAAKQSLRRRKKAKK